MRLLPAVFGLVALIALGAQAFANADKGSAPAKFDAIGTLSTGKFAIGGETTGITLKTDHGTFELSVVGELARKAQQLDGKKVHVIGTLRAVSGVEVKERQIVVVESLAQVDGE